MYTLLADFSLAIAGSNCPKKQIIVTVEHCKIAVEHFRYEWGKEISSTNGRRPSGCYWKSDTVYFNTNVDPTIADQIEGNRGGICHASMLKSSYVVESNKGTIRFPI